MKKQLLLILLGIFAATLITLLTQKELTQTVKVNKPYIPGEWKTNPYNKPLPPQPTEEEAKHSFPDVNNNKVRDDIEILVVEEWRDHEMMVETLFTQARTTQYELDSASDGEVTQEEVLRSNEFLAKDGACRLFYYTNTVGTMEEYFQEKTYRAVSENYHNSLQRLQYLDDFREASHGSISRSVKVDHDKCQTYFEQTRNLEIGN